MFQREEGRVVQRDAVVHHRPVGESEREIITFTSAQGCSSFNKTRLQVDDFNMIVYRYFAYLVFARLAS